MRAVSAQSPRSDHADLDVRQRQCEEFLTALRGRFPPFLLLSWNSATVSSLTPWGCAEGTRRHRAMTPHGFVMRDPTTQGDSEMIGLTSKSLLAAALYVGATSLATSAIAKPPPPLVLCHNIGG